MRMIKLFYLGIFVSFSLALKAQPLPFMDKNCKWGYVNKAGKIVIAAEYENARPFFKSGKALVRKQVGIKNGISESASGFIDTTGKVISDFKYTSVSDRATVRGWYLAVNKEDAGGFIDSNGNEIFPFKYNSFVQHGGPDPYFTDGFAKASLPFSGHKVFFDTLGKEIKFKKRYYALGLFSEGLAAVEIADNFRKRGPVGFINKSGEEIIPAEKYYGSLFAVFKEGLAMVHDENGNTGYINKTGKIIIPFADYDYGFEFSEGRAVVRNKNFDHGVIDKSGKIIVPIIYKGITAFKNGIALATKKSPVTVTKQKLCVLNLDGKVLKELDIEGASFNNWPGPVSVKRNGKWGLIDTSGKTLVGFNYDNPLTYVNSYTGPSDKNYFVTRIGKSEFSHENLAGCVDAKTYKEIILCKYVDLYIFGTFFIVTDPKWKKGLYNMEGKLIVPCIFDEIKPFVNGYAVAMQNNSEFEGCEQTYNVEGTNITKNYKSFIIDLAGNVFEYSNASLNKIEFAEQLKNKKSADH